MKFLRNMMDRLEPPREKKYLYTTWDAFNTFLFAPNHVTKKGSHIRDGMDIKRTMFHVVIALQLCVLFGAWNIGHQHYTAYGIFTDIWNFQGIIAKLVFGVLQLLPMIVVVHVVGLGIEFIFAAIRRHSVEEGFLVTGALVPLILPPDMPLWMVAIATVFAVVVGKEAFGGTGMNLLNIALTIRVFLFFAWPTYISGDQVWITMDTNFLHDLFGMGAGGAQALVDGFTGATPLGLAANPQEVAEGVVLTGQAAIQHYYSFWDLVVGNIPGSVGETSALAIWFGAVFLLVTKIASWRIMLSMIFGAVVMALILNLIGSSPFTQVPWHWHLMMGGFWFAMAFMATDPVTAAQTNQGKWVYGFFIGVFGMIIRVLNPAYPEGWMLAILFMNVLAPTIDHVVVSQNIKRRLARG